MTSTRTSTSVAVDGWSEPAKVLCRIFLSWKDANRAKKIDPTVKERCVRLVLDHLQEYQTLTAAAETVARREGVGKESVRRWVIQAQIDGGQRHGATSKELAEIKELKAKVPIRDLQRREQRRRSVAHVVVGLLLRHPEPG